jgi:hypothetical protein
MDFIRTMNYGQGVNGALEKFAVSGAVMPRGGLPAYQASAGAAGAAVHKATVMPPPTTHGGVNFGSALPGAPAPTAGGAGGFLSGIGGKINNFLSKPSGQFAAQAGMMVGIPMLMNSMANRDQR